MEERTRARASRQGVLPPKTVVLIPTRNRPKYLHWTVRSVLEQARRHGHKNVEVVISDSSNKRNLEENQRLMERLKKQFPGTPIHLYGPATPEPISKALAEAPAEEREAFKHYVPKNGHYGSHRNRVALLGLYHGGRDAVYLHLDDDSPIGKLDKTPGKEGRTLRADEDVLGIFRQNLETAFKRFGEPAYSGAVEGVPDAFVSNTMVRKPSAKMLKRILIQNSQLRHAGHHFGQARILLPQVMAVPYVPYGLNEDVYHAALMTSHWRRLNPESPTAYSSSQQIDDRPFVLHVGVKGSAPNRRQMQAHLIRAAQGKERPYSPVHANGWKKLATRIIRLGTN